MEVIGRPLSVGLGGSRREKSWSRLALIEALKIADLRGAETELLVWMFPHTWPA